MTPAGVLLTGGASRRLGTDKARLRRPDGLTLAEHAAGLLRATCAGAIEVGDGASGLPAVREDPPLAGPLVALLAGVDALLARHMCTEAAHVVVLGCDYPRLDVSALERLVAAEPAGATAIATTPDGRLHYVCARLAPDDVAEARGRATAGERALRWLATLPHVAVELPADQLVDVDTPADAEALGLCAEPAP